MLNKETQPLVSVVMPTYNEPPHIVRAAIESILHQTYRNWELFILDDSTSEQTRQAIDDTVAGDCRIKVIRQEEKMGFVPALNLGIELSHGLYVARMDGDDISLPDRLAHQVAYLTSHPDVDILGGAMNLMDGNSERTSVRHYPSGGLRLLCWMALRDPVGHPSVMFRKSVFEDGLYYDESMNKGCEDTEFWLRLRNHGYKIANIREPLIDYRITVDMALKREKDNNANYIARKKNFSLRYFFLDCISLVAFKIRMMIPTKCISWLYSKENYQRC